MPLFGGGRGLAGRDFAGCARSVDKLAWGAIKSRGKNFQPHSYRGNSHSVRLVAGPCSLSARPRPCPPVRKALLRGPRHGRNQPCAPGYAHNARSAASALHAQNRVSLSLFHRQNGENTFFWPPLSRSAPGFMGEDLAAAAMNIASDWSRGPWLRIENFQHLLLQGLKNSLCCAHHPSWPPWRNLPESGVFQWIEQDVIAPYNDQPRHGSQFGSLKRRL